MQPFLRSGKGHARARVLQHHSFDIWALATWWVPNYILNFSPVGPAVVPLLRLQYWRFSEIAQLWHVSVDNTSVDQIRGETPIFKKYGMGIHTLSTFSSLSPSNFLAKLQLCLAYTYTVTYTGPFSSSYVLFKLFGTGTKNRSKHVKFKHLTQKSKLMDSFISELIFSIARDLLVLRRKFGRRLSAELYAAAESSSV